MYYVIYRCYDDDEIMSATWWVEECNTYESAKEFVDVMGRETRYHSFKILQEYFDIESEG